MIKSINNQSTGKTYFKLKRGQPNVKNYGCNDKYGKPAIHGAREMERRKRQIISGRLKVENGLAV